VPAAFNTMFTTKFHHYVRPDGDYTMPESIDLIDGDGQHVNGQDFMSLLSDQSALYRYCYIIIESGNAYEAEWLADPQAMAALRGWVEDGGRLALTGQAYDFGEQLFPAYVDFAGSAELDGLGTEPEARNAAQLDQQAVTITLEDHCYYGEYGGTTIRQLLEWRGLNYVPSVFMPADYPRIADQGESVFTHLRMIPADPAEVSTPRLAVTYRPELGRVLQICFPIEQASQDAGQMTALFLDLLAFSI